MPRNDSYAFTPDMEKAAVRQILSDPVALSQMHRNVRPEGFDNPHAILVVKTALDLFKQLTEAPTKTQVFQELKDEIEAGNLIEQKVQAAEEWTATLGDTSPVPTAYVVEKVLGRERERALLKAIEDVGDLHVKGEFDAILPAMERADAVGKLNAGKGVDLMGDLEKRTRRRLKYKAPQRQGTGIPELDDLMGGGLSLDNPLGLVMGGPKSGKSLFLDAVELHAMSAGLNVAVFTLENGEDEVSLRHDAAIADMDIDQVWTRAEDVHERVLEWRKHASGSIWVRKMPSGVCVRDTEAELDIRRFELGWEPNLIVWDYTKLMNPNDPKKWDRRSEELGAITLEMRQCLERRGAVGWSAAQVKNSAIDKETPVAADIGYSTEMVENVDAGVAICRTMEERNDQLVRFFLAISRFSIDAVQTKPLLTQYKRGRIVSKISGLIGWPDPEDAVFG